MKCVSEGLELLGSLICGTDKFHDQFLSCHLAKVVAAQDSIAILKDPQVEFHLPCSYLESYKIIHLLHTEEDKQYEEHVQ